MPRSKGFSPIGMEEARGVFLLILDINLNAAPPLHSTLSPHPCRGRGPQRAEDRKEVIRSSSYCLAETVLHTL